MTDRDRRRTLAAVTVSAAAIDLATKALATTTLDGGPVDLPGPLDLRLVHNRGIAFGFGNDAPVGAVLVLTLAVAGVLAVAAWRGALGGPIGAGLMLGGALANVADRAVGGSVVDMFDLRWWPTFNVADIFITLGAAVLVLASGRAAGPGDRQHEASAGGRRPNVRRPAGS